jgi:hypothetical protein
MKLGKGGTVQLCWPPASLIQGQALSSMPGYVYADPEPY